MIASLSGTVTYRDLQWLILQVGGVGYQVFVPAYVIAPLDSQLTLFTSHQIREDSQQLFGFPTLAERALFELLLSVSGVGPKSALAIVGIGSIERIQGAIVQGETALFEAVPGIGKKVAAKIIVELKTKVGGSGALLPNADAVHSQLVEALESLGYRRAEVLPVLRDLPGELGDLQAQIRWSLKRLSG